MPTPKCHEIYINYQSTMLIWMYLYCGKAHRRWWMKLSKLRHCDLANFRCITFLCNKSSPWSTLKIGSLACWCSARTWELLNKCNQFYGQPRHWIKWNIAIKFVPHEEWVVKYGNIINAEIRANLLKICKS